MALLRFVASLASLAALALLAPPALDLHASAIDHVAAEAGLRSRVPTLDAWQITVRDAAPGANPSEVELVLRGPDGRSERRRLALAGTSPEDRSRELAASLALIITQWDDPQDHRADTTTTTPTTPAPASPLRGWLGLGPRMELGRSLVEGGLDVQGGTWLLHEHLQPLASLGWSTSARAGLGLHTLRLGLGLAAGAPLPRTRLWLGAHALAHGAWTTTSDRRSTSAWASSSELGALLQIRWPRWLIGVRTGVDLALPPLKLKGDHARVQRGPAQFIVGLQIGLVFG